MNAIDDLSTKLAKSWPAIDAAREASRLMHSRIAGILQDHDMVPIDASFVVFGSLAREELTVNSDVDWTLLIDGAADPEHLKVAQRIASRLEEAEISPPNPAGAFGRMAFSHQLIQNIGGDNDSNSNTTQRVLLLLESKAIGDPAAYSRVLSGVLNRYLDDDTSFLTSGAASYKVPRFLLNDIVRYWRTMCVDYASKHRERQGQGWALRNAKLRLSRKLIFVSGLLTCYGCLLDKPVDRALPIEIPSSLAPLLGHLVRYVTQTPLEILAGCLLKYGTPETGIRTMRAYNDFLAFLNDGRARGELSHLESKDAQSDPTFRRVREMGRDFQSSLTSFFFDENVEVARLTREYGLF